MPDWRGAAEGIPAPDGRRASAQSCAARHLADDAPGPCGSSSTKGSREVTVVPRPFSGPRYTGLARRCSALTRGPTDGHPRAQVDHRRQIQPSFTGAQIGDVSEESGPGHLPDAGRVRGGGTLSAVSTHPVPHGAFPHPDVVSDLLHRAARGQDNTHGIITESSRKSGSYAFLRRTGHPKRRPQSSCLTKPCGRSRNSQIYRGCPCPVTCKP